MRRALLYTDSVIPRGSRTYWVIAVALSGLLVALGTLQYRWLSQISEAERERTLARMHAAAIGFARDFDRELIRAFATFGPPGLLGPEAVDLGQRSARWEQEALVPELVRAVFIARPDHAGRVSLSRLDRQTGRFAPTEWPAELRELPGRLERFHNSAAPPPGPARHAGPFVPAADVPALVVYLPPPPPRAGGGSPSLSAGPERGFLIIWLARDSIQGKLLPELTARHFGGPRGVEYHVEVTAADDPGRVLFRAGPTLGDDAPPHAHAVAEFFALLPPDAVRAMDPPPPGTQPAWRLSVAAPSGMLEATVARTQRRNLIVGFGVLLLLGVTMVMMLATTHRSRRLAQQQFEFVTGVTHELRTPLAAMRSAAQNLADGVVRDPRQVTTYGALIDREARRLGDMVDQVLEFASMRSGRITLDRKPVAIEKVIEEALAECRPTLEEKGIRVETDYAALPAMLGDARALRHAVVNLLRNSLKYGAAGGWIGIRAHAVPGSPSHVEVTVEDSGAGIAVVDLPHIFEPFYRGRGRSSGPVPGSGLGLTLVRQIAEAHGGRVTVQARQPNGTAFTLHLPTAS